MISGKTSLVGNGAPVRSGSMMRLLSTTTSRSASSRRSPSVAPPLADLRSPPSYNEAKEEEEEWTPFLKRRDLLASLVLAPASAAMLLQPPPPAMAIQGSTAGRIPGISSTPDENGYFAYTRPEGKSGGHGIGWSEVPRYAFKVPSGWAEIPVSIADLGGTEIDLRFSSKEQGELSVVVAPVLRFVDVGFNANIKIEQIGTPDKIIQGFGPELFGKPIDDEDILDTQVEQSPAGLTYYYWQLKPHNLVTATAVKSRIFLMSLRANASQWKKHKKELLTIQHTFDVPYEIAKAV